MILGIVQLFAVVGLQTNGSQDAIGLIGQLIPEGASVAAVIIVVVLFLRRQKESQDEYQRQIESLHKLSFDRDKMIVEAIDRLAARIEDIGREARTVSNGKR